LKTFTFAVEKVLYVSLTIQVLKPEEYNQKVKEHFLAKSTLNQSNASNQDHGSLAARRGNTAPSGDSSTNFDPMDIDKD